MAEIRLTKQGQALVEWLKRLGNREKRYHKREKWVTYTLIKFDGTKEKISINENNVFSV